MSKTIYERIFKRLIQLGIDPQNPPEYAKSRSKGFMDLNLDLLYKTTDCMGIALAHYFEQHGDLVPDPDMQIRVYPATKMAEALTYQDQFGYREVYPQPGKVNIAAKKDLNIFLNQWLKNCLEQGHSFRKAGEGSVNDEP
jgi:uncharacterized protein YqiB (DUF1249 family)